MRCARRDDQPFMSRTQVIVVLLIPVHLCEIHTESLCYLGHLSGCARQGCSAKQEKMRRGSHSYVSVHTTYR